MEIGELYGVDPPNVIQYRSSVVKGVTPREEWPDWNRPVIKLGFVGRFSAEKSPSLFLDVVAALTARGWQVVGTMVGDGELMNEVSDRVAAEELAVSLVGWIDDRTALADILAQQDVLLVTSPAEGSPKIVVEGMAVGTPSCIAARNSTIDSYREAGALVVVPDFSPEAWAAAIASIWNADSYRELVRHGQRVARSLTLSSVVEQIRCQLRKLCGDQDG